MCHCPPQVRHKADCMRTETPKYVSYHWLDCHSPRTTVCAALIRYGFNCTKGWDPATGVGTPHFGMLLAAAMGTQIADAKVPAAAISPLAASQN